MKEVFNWRATDSIRVIYEISDYFIDVRISKANTVIALSYFNGTTDETDLDELIDYPFKNIILQQSYGSKFNLCIDTELRLIVETIERININSVEKDFKTLFPIDKGIINA